MADITNQENPYMQFESWIHEQPCWLQDAIYRIYHALPIETPQVNGYADMCIAQIGGNSPKYRTLEANKSLPVDNAETLSILKVHNIKGVNALSEKAELDFGSCGITIVYGLNGAGKSGFMRMFKKASNSIYAEQIQPNVFRSEKPNEICCDFTILHNGSAHTVCYDLTSNSGCGYMQQCDVFDTSISAAYIKSKSEVSFQPFVFTVLSKVAQYANEVKSELEHREKGIKMPELSLPTAFNGEQYAEWLLNIDSTTEIPDECMQWNDSKEVELLRLSKLVDAEEIVNRLKARKAGYDALKMVYDDLSGISIRLSSGQKEKCVSLWKRLSAAKEQNNLAKKLFDETADKHDQISATANSWKQMWNYAMQYYAEFYQAEMGKPFATEGSVCPLCHQTVTGNIAKRMQSINDYVNGSCNTEFNAVFSEYTSHVKNMLSSQLSEPQVTQLLQTQLSDDTLVKLQEFYRKIADLRKDPSSENVYIAVLALDCTEICHELGVILSETDKYIREETAALENEQHTSLESEYRHLIYLKWVYDNKSLIQDTIKAKEQIVILKKAQQLVKTNKITAEANYLANALITDAYITRFNNEINFLAPTLKVKLEKAPSQKGRSPYKVFLDTDSDSRGKPEIILSEGEQRIVSLAAFFAEATGRTESTPIIIDDPISSLDINYEDSATKRITQLAGKRQVIVFTHRISLLVAICNEAESCGVNVTQRYIRSGNSGKGIKEPENYYHGKIKTQLNGILDNLSRARKMDADSLEFESVISSACQSFRICVERSVEDVLLLQMVGRFRRNIMTNGKVEKLVRITENDCNMVDKMMTKYSYSEHSQPVECVPINFTIDEITDDISSFICWIDEYNRKMR